MRSKPTILKLGGSVITVKSKPLTPNVGAIRRLAGEIAEANISPLIVVHGGGSYGHPLAAKYGIAEGFRSRSQTLGFSRTHNAMISLNMLVVEALLNRGVPAFSIAPSSFVVTRRGRIRRLQKEVLEHAVNLGFVPVLYGDAVFDSEAGFAILSGDQLISRLAVELKAERIIVGVDVDGLFTADPKTSGSAKLISHITLSELEKMRSEIGGSRVTDVTGGMMGKIFELVTPVMRGVEVLILNASKPGNIHKALKGERVLGTRITRG